MKQKIAQLVSFAQRAGVAAPLSLAAALACGASAANADLIGATVSIAGYCCTAPIPADLFTNTLTGTVPISFPVGSLKTITALAVIPSSFDVTGDQITQSFAASELAASGGFNGVVYTFSGAPAITNVTVDALSTQAIRSLSFTSDSIAVNYAGLVTTNGASQILDITTGAVPPPVTIPEPSTFALFAASLGSLVFARRRARR